MRLAAPLLALLILLAGTPPAVAVAEAGPSTHGVAESAAPTTPTDRPALVAPSPARIDSPNLTEIHVAPDPGGDARWTVSIRYNLSTDADRAAFDRYGERFESGDADVGLHVDFFRTLADEASRATGREMSISDTRRNATVRNGTGVLSLSFTWTNFVTDTEEGFVIQDAVLMPHNRTWLTSIGPGQRLVVETPSDYQVTDTRFGLDNGSVVVEGPHTFEEPLTISYQRAAVEEPTQRTPWSLIGGAVFLGLCLVAALVYVRRYGGDDAGSSAAASDAPDIGTDSSSDAAAATDGTPDADSAATVDDAAVVAAGADGDAGTDDAVDPSLLSDEERVEHLLDQNGGRMKQAQIVRETGWSDAKVSQLLSTMAEEDRIEKLRLGRENLISLPDEEP